MKLPPMKVVVACIIALFLMTGYLLTVIHGKDTVAAHIGASEFYGDWQNTVDSSQLSISVEKEELLVKSGDNSSRFTLDRDGRSFLEMSSDPTRPIRHITRNSAGELELSILQTGSGSLQVVRYRRKR
jgi:hypothetical protein